MQFLESILIALTSLKTNKLRSILTLIGVIIGVMTVIAVASIITGMNRHVSDKISTMGSTTFIIDRIGIIMSDEEWWEAMKRKRLTLDDMEAIRDNCGACEMVGGQIYTRRKVKHKNQYLYDVLVRGVTTNVPQISNFDVEHGRHISEFEELHRRQVVFVGWEIADKLFPNVDPIGKEVKVGGRPFKIVGVAEKKGSFLGNNQDNFVMIPITTFLKVFGTRRNLDILVKTADLESMREAQDQARTILRVRRKVPHDKPDDFAILTTDTFMQLYRNFTSTAYMVMIGVSSIALVVGGIVIMNIMLVSVTQRTKEVGIRKAMGAKKRDILWQFLVEAVTVSVVGGIIGIVIGASIAKLVSATTPLPSAVELWSVIIGLLISSSVGIFFGIYPAMKAARLNPIEALRYE
jgi:putative ABC transport system permease protein